ncbi:hypothetical protein OHR68_06415 [Spirillospora sp. NBC_00431]
MDQATVVLIAPDHVPDEIGGSFADARQALALDPAADGYVLYLLDMMIERGTVIGTDTRPVREVLADQTPASGGHLACSLTTARKVLVQFRDRHRAQLDARLHLADFLTRDVAPLLHGSYTDAVGRELFTARAYRDGRVHGYDTGD